MNYTLHQLQIFLTISKTQSITKAAEELFLSQPAVSIQLKNFQDQFDIPLTEVVGRKLFITDFGRTIAIAAENILKEVYAINYASLAYKGQLSGRLNISVVSTGKYVMPYFLSGFMKLHPGVELILDVTNKAKVLESLEKNEVDFSLVSILPDNMDIEKIELMSNKLFFVSRSAIEGLKNDYTHILESSTFIYREKGSGTRLQMEQYIAAHHLPIGKKIELTSNEAVKQAVIAGLGCSIMPLIGIKNELISGELTIIPIEGFPLQTNWNLIWLKAKKFSPVARAFLQYLEQEKASIIENNFEWINQFVTTHHINY